MCHLSFLKKATCDNVEALRRPTVAKPRTCARLDRGATAKHGVLHAAGVWRSPLRCVWNMRSKKEKNDTC